MNDYVVFGLCLVAVVIIVEVVLSMRWNAFYFTHGVPIFWRRVERAANMETLSLERLEKASATAAGAALVFRRLSSRRSRFVNDRSAG